MKEKLAKQREEFLGVVLTEVPFKGWCDEVMSIAEGKLSWDPGYSNILFEDGLDSLIIYYEDCQNKKMLDALSQVELTRVRDKIKEAVKTRLEIADIAVLKALVKFYTKPQNLLFAAKNKWRVVDEIWYFAGDQSTDYNYYTKRGLLFAIYGAVLAYYINDQSEGHENSWDFLDKKIETVLKIGKLKNFSDCLSKIKKKIPFIRLMK